MKKYTEDIVYRNEEDSDFENDENDREGKMKSSNQLKECSDSSSKDELLTDKPAMNTLKKTFSAMLSKMPVFARSRADTSSISDNCSVMSKSSKAWDATSTIDRALFNRGSGRVRRYTNIGRANSTAFVNIKNSGIRSNSLFDKLNQYFIS